MRIVVAGAGYVGLVAGTCFAETGHEVILVDVDLQKIETLRRGEVPFYEPGLGDLLERNIREGRLSFTQDLDASLPKAKVVFIAVGTPQSHDGSADLKYVLQVASSVARAMVEPLVVVLKSTVPVGTADKVRAIMQAEGSHPAFIVSNPEFLKEGAAVDDFLKPDRVVVG
ncbi:MAG: UDP-glucose/GDP-mannose dehydrogenase family protein, partial [Lentisphaeria bacterium]|nr:UDP-glucose/GDP-mannose dehydrogenase family protein [Lentisphaeria bacterium]